MFYFASIPRVLPSIREINHSFFCTLNDSIFAQEYLNLDRYFYLLILQPRAEGEQRLKETGRIYFYVKEVNGLLFGGIRKTGGNMKMLLS